MKIRNEIKNIITGKYKTYHRLWILSLIFILIFNPLHAKADWSDNFNGGSISGDWNVNSGAWDASSTHLNATLGDMSEIANITHSLGNFSIFNFTYYGRNVPTSITEDDFLRWSNGHNIFTFRHSGVSDGLISIVSELPSIGTFYIADHTEVNFNLKFDTFQVGNSSTKFNLFVSYPNGSIIINKTSVYDINTLGVIGDLTLLESYNMGTWDRFYYDNFQVIMNPSISMENAIITTDKTAYNLGDIIFENYTIANADTYNFLYTIRTYDENNILISNFPLNSVALIPTITNLIGNNTPINDFSHIHTYRSWIAKRQVSSDSITQYLNYTTFRYGTLNFSVFNITTDKSIYNTTETIKTYFNTSFSGRLVYSDSNSNHWYVPIVSGNNQEYDFYLSPIDFIGTWHINLEYDDGHGIFNVLKTVYITVISGYNARIDTDKRNYEIGDLINIISYSNDSGYVSLFDTNGNIIDNYSIPIDSVVHHFYSIPDGALTGIWNVNLYNSAGSIIVATNNFNVGISSIVPTPTLTPIPTSITPTPTGTGGTSTTSGDGSLIGAGAVLGKVVIGTLDTDENGDIQNTAHNKNIGNNLFYTLIVIVLIIFVFGAFKGHREK